MSCLAPCVSCANVAAGSDANPANNNTGMTRLHKFMRISLLCCFVARRQSSAVGSAGRDDWTHLSHIRAGCVCLGSTSHSATDVLNLICDGIAKFFSTGRGQKHSGSYADAHAEKETHEIPEPVVFVWSDHAACILRD